MSLALGFSLSKAGYEIVEGGTFVTRPEWDGWYVPLPATMKEEELREYLHDYANAMSVLKLSYQAVCSAKEGGTAS
jgi:hypothetical protein